jgi:hypothetical protein
MIEIGRLPQRQVLDSATQPNRSVGEMTCPLGDSSLRKTYATSDEAHVVVVSSRNHHASLPILESNASRIHRHINGRIPFKLCGKACEDRVSKGSGLGCHTYSRSRAIFLIRFLILITSPGLRYINKCGRGKSNRCRVAPTPAASLGLITHIVPDYAIHQCFARVDHRTFQSAFKAIRRES